MKHLVLLGGGPEHLRVLHELAASPLPSTRVTLVAPHGRHVSPSLVAGWIAGRLSTAECSVALAPVAALAGADYLPTDVLAVDAGARRVSLANGHTLDYDVLSVDVPGAPDRDRIAGARENALFHRPLDHFLKLWGALVALAGEQSLNIVVVGSEAPAIELAIALPPCLGKRVRVALVTGGGPPLPRAVPSVQQRARRLLKRGHVTLFEERCDALFGNQMLLGQGLRLACDAPLVALEAGPPRWAADSGLALGHRGFLKVHDTLQSASHAEVFATGEIAVRGEAWRPEPGDARGLRSSPLALNLRRQLAGGALVARGAPTAGPEYIDVGGGRALAVWGPVSLCNRMVGWWKARDDRRRLTGLRAPGAPLDAGDGEREPFLPTQPPPDDRGRMVTAED